MHLLLIEDDPSLSHILSRDLQELGFKVECSLDGEDGIYKATNWPYDIIILDIMLPKVNGWAVLKKLRQTHQTPVLMLTAKDSLKDRVTGLEMGADDYLTKPFHFDELVARLTAILRRSYGMNGATLSAQNIKLNIETKVVTIAGTEEILTAREFRILEILLARKGKIIAPDTLRDFLAAPGEEIASGTLDVHIYNLRKKLGKQVIRTVRGVGYTIDA